jgi:hypothetical protein
MFRQHAMIPEPIEKCAEHWSRGSLDPWLPHTSLYRPIAAHCFRRKPARPGSMMTNKGRTRCLRPAGVWISLSTHGYPAHDRATRLDEPCLLVEWGDRDGIPPTRRFESWLMVTQSWPKCSRSSQAPIASLDTLHGIERPSGVLSRWSHPVMILEAYAVSCWALTPENGNRQQP